MRGAWLTPGLLAFAALPQGSAGAASRPAEARMADADRRIRALQETARKLASQEEVDLAPLVAEFAPPPADADRRTRALREEVTALEDRWLLAREERAEREEKARARAAAKHGTPESAPATRHPLAVPDPLRAGAVLLRGGFHERALEALAKAEGAEARYLEARALDALDRVDEAAKAYAKAKELAQGDARLLASIERGRKALEWKTRFGRPEDLTEPIRRSAFSEFEAIGRDRSQGNAKEGRQ